MHLTPHFLSSNQDIVVCSQEQKFRVCYMKLCHLKCTCQLTGIEILLGR